MVTMLQLQLQGRWRATFPSKDSQDFIHGHAIGFIEQMTTVSAEYNTTELSSYSTKRVRTRRRVGEVTGKESKRFKIYMRRFKLGGGAWDDGSGVRSGVLIN